MTDETKKPKKPRKLSRPERWAQAVGNAQNAHAECDKLSSQLEKALSDLENALSELESVKSEYEEWQGNMPDSMQGSATYEKLEEVGQLAVDDAVAKCSELSENVNSGLSEINDLLSEAESIDLPQGFGRD